MFIQRDIGIFASRSPDGIAELALFISTLERVNRMFYMIQIFMHVGLQAPISSVPYFIPNLNGNLHRLSIGQNFYGDDRVVIRNDRSQVEATLRDFDEIANNIIRILEYMDPETSYDGSNTDSMETEDG